MKLFVVQEGECQGEFDKLTGDITTLLITICQRLMRRPKVQLVHTALFLLHCQAKVSSYHSFDRFMYSCAAILVASKLTEHIEFYPIHILKALRIILRQQRGISQPDEQDQEEQTKLKMLTKRLFEAEVNLMINIGFDFDIELGLFWLQEWSRSIGDSHVLRKTEEAMTSFYQTTAVLYFQPQVVALACLSIVMKNEGINPALCGWDPALLALLGDNEERIKEAKNMYLSRQRYRYS